MTQAFLALASLLALFGCRSEDAVGRSGGDNGDLLLAVAREPSARDLQRVGINLGHWTAWGAQQLMRNVLKNPGFEGVIDRALVDVAHADASGFSETQTWLARPDGFWIGAQYDVRTGRQAGHRGTLIDSLARGEDGLPRFRSSDPLPRLVRGDVVALTRENDTALPTQWTVPETARGLVHVERGDRRPGSPGRRSLVLEPVDARIAAVVTYLDGISPRAGKLLPVSGEWRLAFWSRGEGSSRIRVRFGRAASPAFVDEERQPGRTWTRTVISFRAQDTGPDHALELRLEVRGEGRVLIDDAELGPVAASGLAFRPEVLEILARLRPGILRDWQSQLGETLENRLASPWARRASRWRPGGPEATDVHYSLVEFLDLAAALDANPWIVVPPVFSDLELVELGRYLARRQHQDHFREIVVELGNENWNPIFRAASLPDPVQHRIVAAHAFARIRAGAGPDVPLRTAVNGPVVDPARAMNFARGIPDVDLLALAPYYLHTLETGVQLPNRLGRLFGASQALQQLRSAAQDAGIALAVAEVNLHTTQGDASPEERADLTVSAAGGVSLARALLRNYALGIRRQCVWNLAQHDTQTADGGFTPLWGVARDLGPTRWLRPTGLAVELLNRVVAGDLHVAVAVAGEAEPSVEAYAFRTELGWAAVLVSRLPQAQRVELAFPTRDEAPLPQRAIGLQAPTPAAKNETSKQVRLAEVPVTVQGRSASVSVPAWGLVALIGEGGRS